jgi:predicted nucleotidyltransferase
MEAKPVLGSRAGQAILARTLLAPDRELYLRELVRLTGLAVRTVQVAVGRLVAADLLLERRSGNRRYFRANERHPLFRPLRELLLKTAGLVGVLRDALGTQGVEFAFVFGSMAAASGARAASDVDLLIVGELGLREAVRRLAPAHDRLGREINPVVWSRAEYDRRRAQGDHFLATVLAGPRAVVAGELGDAEPVG